MATRRFKRDARGRFAFSDTPTRKGKTREEKEAAAQTENFKELRQERDEFRAGTQLETAEKAATSAEKAYRAAKKIGTDFALETAWDVRIKAQKQLVAAMRRRAKIAR